MAPKYSDLVRMSKAELIKAYDSVAPNTVVGLEWFRFELWRRESNRQTATIVRLTWVIAALTAFISVLTFIVLAEA